MGTQRQCQILVMNIDLKFKSTQKVMYLVAMENDDEWKDRMKWKIQYFLDCDQIQTRFGISRDLLPESSRNALREHLNRPPIRRNLKYKEAMEMINKTRFEKLLSKSSKRRSCTKCPKKGNKKCSEFRLDERRNGGERMCLCGHSARDHGIADGERVHCILRMDPRRWKKIVKENWSKSKETDLVPVVVNKKDRTFIEWKKPIHFHYRGRSHSVMLSLLYDEGRWQITCMDYDAGRIFYQHRLISDQVDSPEYKWTYHRLTKNVTVKLQFDHPCHFRRRG